MTNDDSSKNRSTASLFGGVQSDSAQSSAAQAEHEVLAKRRSMITRVLLALVVIGVVVVAVLVWNGTWHNAKAKAKAKLEKEVADAEAERKDRISYGYNGCEDALLKIEWLGRNQERANNILKKIGEAAVEAKPSEVCVVTAQKPLMQGLPDEEYEIHLSINGSKTAEILMEDGATETVVLDNEMEPELFCAVINQYHAKLYGEVAYPLYVTVPEPEEPATPVNDKAEIEAAAERGVAELQNGIKLPVIQLNDKE